ncbi:PD-(D/E)XK motif protein [Brevibacillus parabrevis]|uniref:PD-(D/E)XK motif protein n=1 Tax=Brevibacillus parabrevis TaxID=54914 RepID=UPI00248F999C|nr:PD-(D/E)XK motif protein [Brevibacillus parabrevis]
MMSVTNEIYAKLENDIKLRMTPDIETLQIQLLSSRSKIQIILAVEPENYKRYVLIELNTKISDQVFSMLPTWSGITLKQSFLEVYGQNKWYLILMQVHEVDKEIFEAMVSQICDALLQINQSMLITELQNQLDRWKTFFLTYGDSGLSKSEQKGLYGELFFLKKLIQSVIGITAIKHWYGSEKTRHDFQFNSYAIEVKTTTSKKHYTVRVASENQLDDRGLNGLFLEFLAFNEMEYGDSTLSAVVDEIRKIINHNNDLRVLFEQKLIMAGYVDSHRDRYNTSYSLRTEVSFQVKEGFPRLLPEDLQKGVGDISYSIELSVCEPFKISSEELLSSVIRGTGA